MFFLYLAFVNLVCALPNITLDRMLLSLEETHDLEIDANTEYILDFLPNEDQRLYPPRVWISVSEGDPERPLLITHRQPAGAGTWQLPRAAGGRVQLELERTLCPADSSLTEDSECASSTGEESLGWFSLHALSSCARTVHVRLRVEPARDWFLRYEEPLETVASVMAPRVHRYEFPEDQDSVRLVLESDDDVCATIVVQPLECPIMETLEDITTSTIRMTMLRSGAVQLSKSRFPLGFYVVVIVHTDDVVCNGEETIGEDWLLQEVLIGGTVPRETHDRRKELRIDTRPSLSRAQYLIACAVSVGVFAAFYAACGAAVLAQRLPACARFTAPKAVLANKEPDTLQSQTDAVEVDGSLASPRARRLSTVFDVFCPIDATFDSSDMSDSDSDDDAEIGTPQGRSAAVSPARSTISPAPSNPDRATATSAPGEVIVEDGSARNGGAVGRSNETAGVHFVTETNNTQNSSTDAPFGLPARLRVAALSRRRARVLRSRTDRYLTTLATVAVFYALPGLQLVFAFQIYLNVSGSLDTCYYNFLCAHPAGVVSDFNHVFSNLGYLLLGALFMLQLRRRRRNRKREPRNKEYGIPEHYGLLAALGAGMMVVALLSATYHICPNQLNFQFDTAFMYVLAVLSMVKLYQARHPDVSARAHATFGVLAVLIAIVVWGVLGNGPLFWGVWTVLHVFTFLLLSLRIYYVGQLRLEARSLQWAASRWRERPLYTARLVMLLIANAANWAFAIYGMFTQSANFASHLLYLLLGNALLYMCFYLVMKLLHGERPRWYSWLFTLGAAAAWAPGLFLFVRGSSSWSATPARSRHYNHECTVLHFYDAHDLWHVLSAIALYFSFNAMLTWDDGLAAVPRTEIAVF